ncbi:protein IVY1 [Colletotrichum liriopes]|uniref:Protein IVY1 n=1 Tax=Colletotrichum liriopes TaxID=708192 RepID=A0AA37GLT2_9PEZI|nr:protein IVY1 [Colletotrichum liriopes]
MTTEITPGDDRPSTPTPSQLPPVPASPVYSLASTANPLSSYHLPLPPPPRPVHAVLTKSDLELSQTAYSDLIQTAKSYRIALASLSTAASAFGSALESCARLKEARAESLSSASQPGAALSASFTAGSKGSCTADLLMSASGVHHLVANHQQILSETVYRDFEVPLLHELDKWRQRVEDEEEAYVREVKTRNLEIRRLEKEGLKLHKQRRRDVGKFRAHLVELTTKLDGLTSLHGDHARTLLRESQDTSGRILEASCSLVRAEVDIFESLARKGWSGGGLDELLEKGADLFASDDVGDHSGLGAGGGPAETAKLFSILPPKSILADAASDVTRHGGHTRGDSLLSDPDRYQSLAAAAASPGLGDDNDADSIFSETNFNRPRGVRPFSPQPIRRHATDVTFDSLGVGLSEESREEDKAAEERRHDVLKEEDEGGASEQQPLWADEQTDVKSPEEEEHGNLLGSTEVVEDAEEDIDIANGTAERGRPGRRWSVNEEDA